MMAQRPKYFSFIDITLVITKDFHRSKEIISPGFSSFRYASHFQRSRGLQADRCALSL